MDAYMTGDNASVDHLMILQNDKRKKLYVLCDVYKQRNAGKR